MPFEFEWNNNSNESNRDCNSNSSSYNCNLQRAWNIANRFVMEKFMQKWEIKNDDIIIIIRIICIVCIILSSFHILLYLCIYSFGTNRNGNRSLRQYRFFVCAMNSSVCFTFFCILFLSLFFARLPHSRNERERV